MKKIFIYCIIIAVCFSNISVLAVNETASGNVVCRSSKITISGQANPNIVVTIFVEEKSTGLNKSIVYANEVLCDNNGLYTAAFTMPDAKDFTAYVAPEYNVFISGEDILIYKTEFSYISSIKRQKLISDINIAKDTGEILSLITSSDGLKKLAALGIDTNKFMLQNDTTKKSICNALSKKRPFDIYDEDEFTEVFLECFLPAALNELSDSSSVGEFLSSFIEFNLSVDSVDVTKDTNMFVSICNYVLNSKPFLDIEDINSTITEGYITYLLNTSNKSLMTAIINKYANNIGIDTDTYYNAYKSDSDMQISINSAIILSMPTGGFKKLSDFKDAFVSKCQQYKPPEKSYGKSSGSGGGKGSGAIVIPEIAQTAETTEKTVLFSDINDVKWAEESIEGLYDAGIISGNGGGMFSPNESVTREQFVKMIVLAFNITSDMKQNIFEDVTNDSWYYEYVGLAYNAGIVSGVSENRFGAGMPISREDAIVIIDRVLKKQNITLPQKNKEFNFTDESDFVSYSAKSIKDMQLFGVINGMDDGRFAPKEPLSRAQAAKIIYELYKAY